MQKTIHCFSILYLLTFLLSCQSKKKELSESSPVLLENRVVQHQKGTDCGKQPDSLRTDCAVIDFSAPKIQGAGAQSAVGKNLATWADQFLIRLLTWTDYNDPGQEPKTVDAAVRRFYTIHDENAGSVASGMFKATCANSELLNDGRYLTLLLDGFSFQGGNRALEEVVIATFDVKTGKRLTWDDLVKDKAALLPLAQEKVRETRAADFNAGFELDEEEPFALPTSYGLASDGLIFHYQPDEILRLGGPTEFTLPYSQLGDNLKVTPPARDTSLDALSDIYTIQGANLIIPPFEIEVNNSSTADKTLAKKKETIIVSAMFWAVPLDPMDKEAGEDGLISVLNQDIELTGDNRVARFEGLQFNKRLLDKMEDQDINLLINIFSGRKSSQDNLLDCGILDMKASQFGYKRLALRCKLIEETSGSHTGVSGLPDACYALPQGDSLHQQPLRFLVECSETGDLQFAGRQLKSYEALMDTLRPLLEGMIKAGFKPEELPGIETSGCLMGNSGAIRENYDELKAALTPKKLPTEMEKVDKKIAVEKKENPVRRAPAGKSAPAGSGKTTVTLKENGDLLVNDQKVGYLEELRKILQETLLKETVIPDQLRLKTVGETGMGMRAEVNTLIAESIAGAKWVRKKNAIAALNTAGGKKLGVATQLELANYQTNGHFAYISAIPKQTNGEAIDYRKTPYAKEYTSGNFVDHTIGLLKYENGAWKLLTYSIGVNKAPVDVWVKTYGAPKGIFVNPVGD